MPTTRKYTFDIDTKRYLNRVNTYRQLNGLPNIAIADAVDIDNFVIGLKDLGLWVDSYIWLLMSQYNVAAGTSLVGLNVNTPTGTLVNSPTWSTSGVVFLNSSAQRIDIPVTFSFGDTYTLFASAKLTNIAATNLTVLSFGNNRGGLIGVSSNGSTLLRNNQWAVDTSSVFGALNGDYRMSSATRLPTIGSFHISGTTYSGPFNGNIHIAFMLKRSITASAQSSLHNLYKNTVGKNLGLP